MSAKLNDELSELQKELDQLLITNASDWHVYEDVLHFLDVTDVKEATSLTRLKRFLKEEQEHQTDLSYLNNEEVPALLLDGNENQEDKDSQVSRATRICSHAECSHSGGCSAIKEVQCLCLGIPCWFL